MIRNKPTAEQCQRCTGSQHNLITHIGCATIDGRYLNTVARIRIVVRTIAVTVDHTVVIHIQCFVLSDRKVIILSNGCIVHAMNGNGHRCRIRAAVTIADLVGKGFGRSLTDSQIIVDSGWIKRETAI